MQPNIAALDLGDWASMLSALVALAALGATVWEGRKNTQFLAAQEYFKAGDTIEQRAARAKVRVSKDDVDTDAARLVASFFQTWGLMARQGALPMWVFDTASGYAALDLYDKLRGFIESQRANNPRYAAEYTWLVDHLNRRLPRQGKPAGERGVAADEATHAS